MRQLDSAKILKELIISENADVSTIAKRNASGDITVRLIRQNYPDQSTMSGGLVFRINNAADNYLRVCNDPSAIRTWLGVSNADHIHSLVDLTSETFTGGNDLDTYNSIRTWVGRTAASTLNRPMDYFSVVNFGANVNSNGQLAWNYSAAELDLRFRKRHETTGTYGAWRKIYHEGYKPTPAEIGAATTDHTHSSLIGNASTATKLLTARTINGVSFDGTANITISDATKLPLTGGILSGQLTINPSVASPLRIIRNGSSNSNIEIGHANATAFLGINNVGQLMFGTSADLNATGNTVWHQGNFNPNLKLDTTANAASATKLATARTISLTGNITGSAAFDGSANISIAATVINAQTVGGITPETIMRCKVDDVTGNLILAGPTGSQYTSVITPVFGLVPYSNGSGDLGKFDNRFNEIHATSIYEDGNMLSNKYAAYYHSHTEYAPKDKVTLENRTTDPTTPANGYMWLRTDL